MIYQIRRGLTIVETVRPTSGTLEEIVNGAHTAKVNFTLPFYVDFYKGDTIEIAGNVMIAESAASWEKVAERQFNYSLSFVHESYLLLDVAFLGLDQNNDLTEGDFFLMANAETVIDHIINNLNRDYTGWVKGNIEETETINHAFANDNCRGALTKLAEAYKTEFWFSGKAINFSKKGSNSGLSFRYGKGNGLKSLTRNVLNQKVVTRLLVKGSDKNLPANYPGKSLRMPGGAFTIADQAKIDRYGLSEDWREFPEIYPKRIGTITSVTDAFTFDDAGLDFDINNQLIPGVSAKVVFQTGQLAGWEFEIKDGGYNHVTKTITILKNKDEKAIEIPSPTGLMPAVGDKYILVDLVMPHIYVDNAEAELYNAALAAYSDISDEAVNYEAVTDRIYLRQNEININLGDYVNIAEQNPNIDKNIRVVGKVTNLLDAYDVKLTLADTVAIANVVRERIAAKAIQRAISANQLTDINRTRQNRKTQAEVMNMIFNPDTGEFLNNKLDVDWLTAQLITVGSKAGDFILRTTFVPNFNGNANSFGWTGGQLAHNQLTDHQNGIWSFNAGNTSGLDPAKAYYIYADCPFNSSVATLIIYDEVIAVDEVPDRYIFSIGVLSSVIDGFRTVSNTRGKTIINGGEIQTGLMKNQSGQPVLDLDTRTFYGAFKFSNGQDVQAVTNQINADLATQQNNIDAVNTLAANAQTKANNALSGLDAIANDNILTPNEKHQTKKEFDTITTEIVYIIQQANEYGLTAIDYTDAYNNLSSYLDGLLSNLNTQSVINGNQFRAYFADYYNQRTVLLHDISLQSKSATDAAEAKAQNALNNANEAKNFINNVLPGDLAALQSQIDGLIETWFFDYVPTLANVPAVNWTTNTERDKHLGDLFYNNLDGKGYRFGFVNGAYEWILLSDTDTASALALAQQAKDVADGKRRVFGAQPFTPYDAGDLWAQGSGGDLMRCVTGRLTGAYNAADWAKASKYTDDTVANQAIDDANYAVITANDAIASAISLSNVIDDISSDERLTPSEKQQLLKDWQIIVGEKPTVVASAQTYNLSYSAFESAYNTLSGYLSPLLSNINSTSDVVGQTLRDRFKAYNDAKVDLLKLVSDAAKGLVDGLEFGVRNYLLKSSFENGFDLYDEFNFDREIVSNYGGIVAKYGQYFQLTTTRDVTNYNVHYFSTKPVKIEPNNQYTFSFSSISGYPWDTLHVQVIFNDGLHDSFNQYVIPTQANHNWGDRSVITFTAPSSVNTVRFRFDAYTLVWFALDGIKLEKGNKATDWTPAPEDVEADYTAKVNAAQAAAQDYALVEAVLKREQAKAYADGIVTAEEQARIDQAAANLLEAKNDAQAKANAAVAAVSIGGRNLVRVNGLVNYYGTSVWEGADYITVSERNVFIRTTNIIVSFGETYTVSGFLKIDGQPATYANFWSWYINTYQQNISLTVNESTGYFVGTYKVVDSVEWAMAHVISVTAETDTSGKTLRFEKLKIEKGNKATDWTPAPEDVQAGIDEAYNSAQTALNTANAAATAAQTAAQAAADALAQASNAESTANRAANITDYLFTTVDGNVVATGTMLVGDALGNNNAGISGVVDNGASSVRFWAGASFANRNTAPFRVQQDGKVYMSDAVIQGELNAGKVGGFTISNGSIRSNNSFVNSERGVFQLNSGQNPFLSIHSEHSPNPSVILNTFGARLHEFGVDAGELFVYREAVFEGEASFLDTVSFAAAVTLNNTLNCAGQVTFAQRVDFNEVVYFNRVGGAFGDADVRMINLPDRTSATDFKALYVKLSNNRIYKQV